MDLMTPKTTESQLALKYGLELAKEGQTVKKTHTRSKRRLVNILRRFEWDLARLTVAYEVDGVLRGKNQGTYATEADFMLALGAFCDPEIVGL